MRGGRVGWVVDWTGLERTEVLEWTFRLGIVDEGLMNVVLDEIGAGDLISL